MRHSAALSFAILNTEKHLNMAKKETKTAHSASMECTEEEVVLQAGNEV